MKTLLYRFLLGYYPKEDEKYLTAHGWRLQKRRAPWHQKNEG